MNDVILSENAPETESVAADFARAVALLSEGLLNEAEFRAVTSVEVHEVPQRLTDTATLVAVQKASLRLRNSGALARLEAARHARDAVSIAAGIMRDTELHPSTRLNAATFVARASGTERAPAEPSQSGERHTVVINIDGDRAPLRIENAVPRTELGERPLSDEI